MIKFHQHSLSDATLLTLYKALLKPRLIEEKMLMLIRKGKVSKWFSSIGQEAIAVGATMALATDEYILPMHRDLGVFTSREVSLTQLFAQFQGKKEGFTKGRDRSFHFGSQAHHIIGMISHLGPQLSVADGIALANKLSDNKKVTLVFSGEGGASEGEFHEALNVAAVWDLPVIFVVENNGYSISTPTTEQYKGKSFKAKGKSYGIESHKIDGNNILEVYQTICAIADDIRANPRPVLIEALTFRMRGHEESSGTDYVPKKSLEKWEKKDPIQSYEKFLLGESILSESIIKKYKKQINTEITKALSVVETYEEILADKEELNDVYARFTPQKISFNKETTTNKRYIDAIKDALEQSLARYDKLILMGQDIAEYGGIFKATEGLSNQYGKDRVRNTPICESAIIGTGLGLAIAGYKSVIEMQFADFVTCGFTQIVNNLAKSHYRWGQSADVVIRMPSGGGIGAGPFHSQSTEAWFFRVPGLKIVYPSSPKDAKGLLNMAIEDPNPVLFFEHKALYRSIEEEIPDEYYTLPIGKACRLSEGEDISIITYGMGVEWVKPFLNEFSIDLIDLRSLLPWDKEMVFNSARKTGKVIVLTEDTQTGSIASEIAYQIQEKCFDKLDAPVQRLGSLDTPIPFNKSLEQQFLPQQKLKESIKSLLSY